MENQKYVPKVGDEIYIGTSLYLTHGEDDFIGGLCTITSVEGPGPRYWISIAEDRGTFTWAFDKEEQEKLKKEFGLNRGHRKPDYREEFNQL